MKSTESTLSPRKQLTRTTKVAKEDMVDVVADEEVVVVVCFLIYLSIPQIIVISVVATMGDAKRVAQNQLNNMPSTGLPQH